MGILSWVILGLVAGAIAKAIHRGPEPAGVLGTLLTGVLGAVGGGLVASALGIGGISSLFSLGAWIIAIAGAMLLLAIYSAMIGTRSDSARPAP